ncbi:cellulose biosynthesis protein BcsC [Bordetella genomosp. 13]|uniref:cellulose biosynthesis protein BcsC n=1 Tax=Bordetella genomosp. 13 TaxID=463040 RepID=UPI0021B4E275|nr:cellulose biosynthesis protein BcsC [Bordetella genomosp. 13]
MSMSRHKIVAGLLATLLHQAGWAQPDAASTLLEQGRYWQSQGDMRRAGQAWEKLLLTDPNQPEALYGMGLAALRGDRAAEAQQYLNRLRRLDANGAYAQRLQQDIALAGGTGKTDLDNARAKAASGDLPGAIADYRQAFQGREPQGELALEYYSRLGYVDGQLGAAIAGLERLSRQSPNNPNIQLALAKHLIRDESRRADGVKLLSQLSRRNDVGADALESWRMGLVWMGNPRPAEKPLFEAYLQAHPDDKAIRDQMQRTAAPAAARTAAARPAAPWRQDPRLARGFAALESGDLASAEAAFQEKLRETPDNADALGGLGVVRMQQNDPVRAQELLSRAASRPGAGGNWKKALNGARYWALVDQAESARESGDRAGARRMLDQAVKLDGGPSAAYNALGRLALADNDLPGAERTFRAVLARHRNDPEAMRGLVSVLAQSGRPEEAMALVQSMGPEQAADVGDVTRLRAAVAAGQARAADQRGDAARAQQLLEDAVSNDSTNPWLRYELARLLLRTGADTEAQRVVDGLLETNPDMADALYTSALVSAERGQSAKAYATLSRVPQQSRTAEMQSLERRLWVQTQAGQASAMARAGQPDQARALLASLEPAAAQDPELLGTIGQAYVDAGDTSRGLALLRPMVSGAEPATDVLLPYAGLLLKAGQDVEVAGVLRRLQPRSMSASQRAAFDDLVRLYTVRQADRLRERGDLVAAYDMLSPVLKQRPNDTLAQGALARMYAAGGDREKALDIYRKLLEREPDNAQLQIGAANVAAQLNDWRYAERSLNNALAIAPDDPDILASAARLYRAQGKTGRAAELYAAAIAAQDKRGAPAMAAAGAGRAAPSDNPFVGRPGQRTQSARSAQVLGDALGEPVPQAAPAVATYAVATGASSASGANAPYARDYPAANAAAMPVPPVAPVAAAQAPRSRTATAAPVVGPSAIGAVAVPAARGGMPAQPAGAYAAEPAPVAEPSSNGSRVAAAAPSTLQNELDEIRQERSPEIRAGVFVRPNNGEAGLSRMTTIEAPVEARMPVGDGKLVLNATPVNVDAGTLGGDYYKNSRFGGGPVSSAAELTGNSGPVRSLRDRGVGASIGYETRGLAADIGTTPLGFERTNVIGGVKLSGTVGANGWYNVNASRRAVTDSVVSYAGVRDPRLNTGLRTLGVADGGVDDTWGAVTANGLSGQIGLEENNVGAYAYGSWHKLLGHNVESNSRTEVGTGAYWRVINDPDRMLSTGVNVGAIFYDNNQRYFTYGHGGYFSPQQFYALSLPVTWAQRAGRFSYKLQGSVGIQHFKEDDADYFPTSSLLQNAAAAGMAVAQGQGFNVGQPVYDGQSKTGIGYSLSGAAEYQLTRNLFMGGTLGLDNATDYRQWAGGLYLRYALYPMTRPMDLPVVPFQSPYSR